MKKIILALLLALPISTFAQKTGKVVVFSTLQMKAVVVRIFGIEQKIKPNRLYEFELPAGAVRLDVGSEMYKDTLTVNVKENETSYVRVDLARLIKSTFMEQLAVYLLLEDPKRISRYLVNWPIATK